MSKYLEIVSRKRKWTPVAVDKGSLVDGSEEALYRALSLRCLEIPVKEFLQQGLEKELPPIAGVAEALMSNQLDEDKHDLGLNYVVAAHGSDSKSEREAEKIKSTWLAAPEHPLLKASILERSVFFVLLPFFRFNGDVGIRTLAADISRDEQTHVALHGMVCHDLGLKTTTNLNRLRRATVSWVMEPPPLTRIRISAPGAPSEEVTCTPARRPCKASAAEDNGTSLICFALTDDTDPVRSFLLMLLYPTTTTSSNELSIFSSDTLTVAPAVVAKVYVL